MNQKLSYLFLVLVLLGIGVGGATASDRDLPPLNDPASGVDLPGKFIWTDIFTSDIAAARKFYSEVFGWEWRWINDHPDHPYGIFYQGDIPMAGVSHRTGPEPGKPYSRWIYYIATNDVEKAIQTTVDHGGRVMVPKQTIAQRGDYAIVADAEDAPFGIMNSSSGDTPDYRAEFGQWIWVGLYSDNAEQASKFYRSAFGYDVREANSRADIIDYVLVSGGHARAAINQLSPESGSKATWLGFVRVQNLAQALDKARASGAEVLLAPEEGVAGDIAIVADPFGAPVGLMTWAYEADEHSEESPK